MVDPKQISVIFKSDKQKASKQTNKQNKTNKEQNKTKTKQKKKTYKAKYIPISSGTNY